MSIRYEVVANNLKAGSYYPRVVAGDRVTLKRLIDDIVSETTVTETDVRAVMNALTRRIAMRLADGQVAELDGLVSFSVSLGEELSGADSVASSAAIVRVNAQPAQALVTAVRARATLEKTYVRGRVPLVTALLDVQSGRENRYTAGNIARLRGDDMKFDQADPDEGVFFVAPDGSATRIETYAQAGPREIMFLIPATLTGPQAIEVRTSYGSEFLRIGRLQPTVQPA